MFIQSHFRETDEEKIVEFIKANPFAAVVSYDGDKPIAAHLPFEITKDDDGQFVLEAHFARANPQWKTFNRSEEILTIFTGAHSYISPRWYNEPHSTVPTWSYMIVHVYGKPRVITDETELGSHLAKLVTRYESRTNYDLTKVPAATIKKLTGGVVGFKIAVTRFEAAFKLNQNRNERSYQNIIAELEKRTDENSHKIADAMKSVEPNFS
jgi:transcriptional regulator